MTLDRLFDRELLERAFDLLAKKLARRRVVGELHIFGGAAMVLVYDERVGQPDSREKGRQQSGFANDEALLKRSIDVFEIAGQLPILSEGRTSHSRRLEFPRMCKTAGRTTTAVTPRA